MYEHGIVATKAWPLHRGHEHLINKARQHSKRVTVLVVWAAGQNPNGEVRAEWVRKTFPDVDVRLVADLCTDDDTPESSQLWALYTQNILDDEPVDAVFSSEPYGARWAQALGATHVKFDTRRTLVPISGTAIRNDPYAHWQYINEEARQFYLKRVLLVGAESTGKSTLCTRLAQKYGTRFVPEYGRIYVEQFENFEALTDDHKRVIFSAIVNEQPRLAQQIERDARLVCFHDTDLFTTALWWEQWQPNDANGPMKQIILEASYKTMFDMILVSDHHTEWRDDGYRDQTRGVRAMFTDRLVDHFDSAVLLSGTWEQRERTAINAINSLFRGSEVTLPCGPS